MSFSEKLYAKLPVWAQHIAVSTYGVYWKNLRFGGAYSKLLAEMKERETYNKEQWNTWQKKELKEFLHHCIHHVPYYRETWTEEQKQAAREGRIQDLPLLGKQPIRHDAKAFCRDDQTFKTHTFHTSGSTGTPIASIYTEKDFQKSIAVREARSANWAGVSFSEPRATFSGRIVEANPNRLGPLYRFNMAEQQVYFSTFHISDDTVKQYIDALKKHKIRWMTGYTYSCYMLAKVMLEQNIKYDGLQAIVTTSEKCTDLMRQTMTKAFGCAIFEEYSSVETAVFASECEKGGLHISPDIGYVEIINSDGQACQPGEVGEIVTTRIGHESQLLVRYRIGDLAAWSTEPCSCGRSMPTLQEVCGRVEDVLYGPDGREVIRFHGVFLDIPHIKEAQIIQEAIDHVNVKVTIIDGYNDDEDVAVIVHRIQERLGYDVRVSVEVVDCIPREKSGKFKSVVCKLDQRPTHG